MARKKYTEVERDIMKEVSNNLKRVSKYKGLSQKDISDLTELSTSTVSDYFNAVTLISMGNLTKIAEALKVSKGEIYPVETEDEKNSKSQLSNKEFMKLAIEDLSTHELTYKGQKLTKEQKAHMLKLIQTAADMMTD